MKFSSLESKSNMLRHGSRNRKEKENGIKGNQIALKLAKLIQKGLEVIVLSGRYQQMLLIHFHINGCSTCHMRFSIK